MFDLTVNTELDDINVAPPQFQPFYKQGSEGRFVLDVENPVVKGAVDAVSGIAKALRSERELNKSLKGKVVDLSVLSEYGSTPEEIKAGIATKIEELQQQLSDPKLAKVNIEKIKQELAQAHAAEKAQKDATIGELRGQLDSMLIDNAARSAIAPFSKDPDLALLVVRQQVAVVEEDGKRQVFVVDGQGDRRYNPATQAPMTIPDLIEEMRRTPKYQRLFDSETPTGMPKPTNGARPAPRAAADLTPTAKIAAGLPARR